MWGFCPCCFISILHSSIKTWPQPLVPAVAAVFQFYIVQLRQKEELESIRQDRISILHSSIKTIAAGVLIVRLRISILHSSIKTAWNGNNFQHSYISILHSSIKTVPPEAYLFTLSISILHSSIKTAALICLSGYITNFNST